MARDSKAPANRSQCRDQPGVCPFVACRYHLALDVTHAQTIQTPTESWQQGRRGNRSTERKVNEMVDSIVDWLDAGNPSCALDVADESEQTLEQTGDIIGVTRERVRQVQDLIFDKLRSPELAELHGQSEEVVQQRDLISDRWSRENGIDHKDPSTLVKAFERFAAKEGNPRQLRPFGQFAARWEAKNAEAVITNGAGERAV